MTEVTEALRQAAPDLVLTSSPVDYHCDHEAASALVRDACFAAPAPNYATRIEWAAAPLDRIPHLYFMDPVEGKDPEGRVVAPDFFGFDADLGLQYRGRIYESRNRQRTAGSKRELYDAMLEIARSGKGPQDQTPSMGCSIKWRAE